MDKFINWTATFYDDSFELKTKSNCIRQYIALRQKGYPIYFPEYLELYECVKKGVSKNDLG